MFENALHDAVVLLAILVIVPICAVTVLRMIGKTKRATAAGSEFPLIAAHASLSRQPISAASSDLTTISLLYAPFALSERFFLFLLNRIDAPL